MNNVKLSEIATIERGRFSARPRNDPRYYGGDIPFIQTGNVSNSDGKIESFSQTLNSDGLAVSKLFPKGSLAITIAANIGDVAEVDFDFACPDSVVVVQPKSGVNPYWLKYFLQTKKSFFVRQATQNAQANINLETIKPVRLLLPPFDEQQKIVEILSACDAAVEQINVNLGISKKRQQQFASRCYKMLLADTKVSQLSEVVEFSSGYGYRANDLAENGEGYPFMNLANVTVEGTFNATFDKTLKHQLPPRFSVTSGDLLLANTDVTRDGVIGAPFVVPELGKDCFFSTDISKLQPRVECSPLYLYWVLRSSDARRHMLKMAHGSTVLHLDISSAAKFKIPLPSLDVQKSIVDAGRDLQSETELLTEQLAIFKKLKRGLMQQLLTGKLRVQGAA